MLPGQGFMAGTASAAAPSNTYTLGFAAGSYTGPSGPISDPGSTAGQIAGGLLTVSRATTGWARNKAHAFSSFAANFPRRTDLGLLVETTQRFNGIKANNMAGAVAGSPGTLPTGWAESGANNGLIRQIVAVGASHPTLGLPYMRLRLHTNGAAATGNIAYSLQMGANSQIGATVAGLPGVAVGANFLTSAWMAVVAGSVFGTGGANPNMRVGLAQTLAGSVNQALGVAAGKIGTVTLTDYDTVADPMRLDSGILTVLDPSNYTGSVAAALIKPALVMVGVIGAVYDLTFDLICPQCERVEDLLSSPSSPIVNDGTNASKRDPDVISFAGGLLTATQGSSATVAVTTNRMAIGQKARPLLVLNGGTNALVRAADGGVSSALPGTPATYRGIRTTWEGITGQRSCVQWGGNQVRIASTGPGRIATANGTPAAVTAAQLGGDCYIDTLTVADGRVADLSGYTTYSADVVCYGMTPTSLIAATEAIQQGRSAIVVGGWREVIVGGMTTGGLAQVDTSNVNVYGVGSLPRRYLREVNTRIGLGALDNLSLNCKAVGEWWDSFLRRNNVPVYVSKGVSGVTKAGAVITGFTTTDGKTVSGTGFHDGSYEGDLLAAAGVSFIVGREARNATTDPSAGFRADDAWFSSASGFNDHGTALPGTNPPVMVPVNPFGSDGVTPLPGVASAPASGTKYGADTTVQAYIFRATMTKVTANRAALPSTPPPGYSVANYEVLLRWMAAVAAAGYSYVAYGSAKNVATQWSLDDIFALKGSGVEDWNNAGPMGLDFLHPTLGSQAYPNADYATRETIWKAHENYARGLFYTLQYGTDARIPAQLKTDLLQYGLCADHYLEPHENDTANWMPQLYVREARRMVGSWVAHESDVRALDTDPLTIPRPIAAGSYPIDSHVRQRYAWQIPSGPYAGQWTALNEGHMFDTAQGGANKMFPVSYDETLPQRAQCTNLTVGFAISATEPAFGGRRMELTAMAIGQAAGIAHAIRCEAGGSLALHDVSYSTLSARLVAKGAYVPTAN